MGHPEMETEESLARQWEARCEIAERGLKRWHENAKVWFAAGKRALEERDEATRRAEGECESANRWSARAHNAERALAYREEEHQRAAALVAAEIATLRADLAKSEEARETLVSALDSMTSRRGALLADLALATENVDAAFAAGREAGEAAYRADLALATEKRDAAVKAIAKVCDHAKIPTHVLGGERPHTLDVRVGLLMHRLDSLDRAETALSDLGCKIAEMFEARVTSEEERGSLDAEEILDRVAAEFDRRGRVIDHLCDGTADLRLRVARARAKRAEARVEALDRAALMIRASTRLAERRTEAILGEDENDPNTPCRCTIHRGACRVCLALGVHEGEDAIDSVRKALEAAGEDVSEMSPDQAGEYVTEALARARQAGATALSGVGVAPAVASVEPATRQTPNTKRPPLPRPLPPELRAAMIRATMAPRGER